MNTSKNSLLIPAAIVIAGALIAAAVIISKKDSVKNQVAGVEDQKLEENMKPVSAEDHILGNPNAKILLVEYSDTECPFCKGFHETLETVMDQYGKDGKVAWVYRPFPIAQLHPRAEREAESAECVAELGGNKAYFDYLSALYKAKPSIQELQDLSTAGKSYEGFDPAKLPALAEKVGVKKTAFLQCLDSGKYKSKIQASIQEAAQAGAQGTPYTILVSGTTKVPIKAGAIPFPQLKSAIDAILAQ